MGFRTIVVLADGDTWTEAEGCSICVVTDEDVDALMSGEFDVGDVMPIVEIGLKEFICEPRPQSEV